MNKIEKFRIWKILKSQTMKSDHIHFKDLELPIIKSSNTHIRLKIQNTENFGEPNFEIRSHSLQKMQKEQTITE